MTRILYIEDQEDIREFKTKIFKRRGYEVDDAATVEDAQAMFASSKPDIVVTDYNLPGKTGLDFVRWLREQDGGKDMPVILLSNKHPDYIQKENNDFTELKIEYLDKLEASDDDIVKKIVEMLRQTLPTINSLAGSVTLT